jgi:hypothetical protein
MSPTIKLIYFAGRGRAEILRLILAAAEMDYINERIPLGDWQSLKDSEETNIFKYNYNEESTIRIMSLCLFIEFPFGAVPILEYDGKILAQSVTIGRFLAKKTGFAGIDDFEQAEADMVVDLVLDMHDGRTINFKAQLLYIKLVDF